MLKNFVNLLHELLAVQILEKKMKFNQTYHAS